MTCLLELLKKYRWFSSTWIWISMLGYHTISVKTFVLFGHFSSSFGKFFEVTQVVVASQFLRSSLVAEQKLSTMSDVYDFGITFFLSFLCFFEGGGREYNLQILCKENKEKWKKIFPSEITEKFQIYKIVKIFLCFLWIIFFAQNLNKIFFGKSFKKPWICPKKVLTYLKNLSILCISRLFSCLSLSYKIALSSFLVVWWKKQSRNAKHIFNSPKSQKKWWTKSETQIVKIKHFFLIGCQAKSLNSQCSQSAAPSFLLQWLPKWLRNAEFFYQPSMSGIIPARNEEKFRENEQDFLEFLLWALKSSRWIDFLLLVTSDGLNLTG